MSITIIECTYDSIILSNFNKHDAVLSLEYEAKRPLKTVCNVSVPGPWIDEASQVIKELVAEATTIFPVTILLPGFALLTRVLKVPKVAPLKQGDIIQAHLRNRQLLGKEDHLAFDIINVGEWEWDVVCTLIKKKWIESFCEAVEPIGLEITSIEPPAIHYYNAFKRVVPNNSINTLLVVIQNLSSYCVFFNQHCTAVHQIKIRDLPLAEEIKGWINLYKKKHPENCLTQILISGSSIVDEDFAHALEQVVELPVRVFLPLDSGNAHLIGSIGAAHRKLFGCGISADLIPRSIKKIWAFQRSKKAILITGVCIAASLLIFLFNISNRKEYYENKGNALNAKLLPLRERAFAIDRNEKLIAYYNDGLSALESHIASNKSWVHFLNALQNALIAVPSGRIHSLKLVEPEVKVQNSWKTELMGASLRKETLEKTRLIHITGSFLMEENQPANDAIDEIRRLMSEIAKIEFIEETKNLHFDTQNLPTVPFSFSLALKLQAF